MDTRKTTINLHRLETVLVKSDLEQPQFVKDTPSFCLKPDVNPKYVKPTFTTQKETIKEGQLPKVILISAAGATGKSELTKYLSATHKMPIFDLSLHQPVGSNSLTGLFFDTLGAKGLADYIGALENGRAAMIIDALDEGYLKTTAQGFNAFIDDIATIASNAKSTPFILLGRTNVIDYCTIYLWEKGIEAEILHIEPFTEEQAKDFIDKHLGEKNYDAQYRTARDYIIESVQGFFRNETEMSTNESSTFIGYAPVLLSIAVLLKEEPNYKALFENLKAKNDKGVDLILTIMSLILKRDREEKILPVIRETLLKDRDNVFVRDVEQKIYSEKEQCARILYFLLEENPKISLTDDAYFDQEYNKMAGEWVREHPFISNRSIQNTVFECYIVAKLMLFPEHQEKVLQYLRTRYKNAFMLFFIFDKLCHERNIHSSFLPYLFASAKSLDDKQNFFGMDIYDKNIDDTSEVHCSVDIFNEADQSSKYEFSMSIEDAASLALEGSLSNMEIVAPINVNFVGKRIELGSPISISCSNLTVKLDEFVFLSKGEGDIILESESFQVDYSTGQIPEVLNHGNGKAELVILGDKRPAYPFADYFQEAASNLSTLEGTTMEKYLRLRTIMMQFRSHSKGGLAKLKDKIEHQRVLKNDLGWEVLNKLKEKGVIYSEAHLYKVDSNAFNEHLGISYIDLKRKKINSRAISFLEAT